MTSRRIFHLIASSVYTLAFIYVYQFFISKKWAYVGFQKIDSSMEAVVAIFLSGILSIFLPIKFSTRGFLLLIAHYGFFIPSFIVISSNGFDATHLAIILISFFCMFNFSALRIHAIIVGIKSHKFYFSLVMSVLLITLAAIIISVGFSNFNLNLFRIYEFRAEATSSMPILLQYLYLGVSKIVSPIVLIMAFRFRSAFFLFVGIFAIVLLFGLTHHKTVLFIPIIVLIFYIFQVRASSVNICLLIFVLFSICASIEVIFLSYIWEDKVGILNLLISRRVLFLPALIDSFYIEFFSDNSKIYWSTSKITFGLVHDEYFTSAPFIIGKEFFGSEATSANTGIIGSGFAHAGFLGVVIYAFFLGILISILESYGERIGHEFTSAVSLPIFVTILNSSDFTTAFLTHGLLLLLLLLMLSPNFSLPRSREL